MVWRGLLVRTHTAGQSFVLTIILFCPAVTSAVTLSINVLRMDILQFYFEYKTILARAAHHHHHDPGYFIRVQIRITNPCMTRLLQTFVIVNQQRIVEYRKIQWTQQSQDNSLESKLNLFLHHDVV